MKKTRIGALVAAAALTLTFAGTAFAASFNWGGNGYPNKTCDGTQATMLWVWTGDSPSGLTINGQAQSGSWEQNGQGSWHFVADINGTNYPPTSASIDYSGDSGVLTLSHCDGSTTTTTTSSESTDSTATTTTDSTTTTTTTVDTETSDTTTDSTTTTVDTETSDSTTDSSTTTTTSSVDTETSDTTTASTTTTSSVDTETTTPDGSVEELTPPSTDAIAPTSSSTVSTGLLLVLAGILAAVLVVVPAAARSRR